MQVDRDRGPVPFHEGQRGADPVGTVRRAAEARWLDGMPAAEPGMIFGAAEARWLAAYSAWHTDYGEAAAADVPASRAAEDARWIEERAASAAFIRTPAPMPWDLTRKLWLLEREASTVTFDGTCGRDLVGWLSDFRADLMRVLTDR